MEIDLWTLPLIALNIIIIAAIVIGGIFGIVLLDKTTGHGLLTVLGNYAILFAGIIAGLMGWNLLGKLHLLPKKWTFDAAIERAKR